MGKGKEIFAAIKSAIEQRDFGSIVRLSEDNSYLFESNEENLTLKGELLQEDSIGVLLQSIDLEKDADSSEAPNLKAVAEAIEKRVNYLLEPLKIIEVDSTTNAVQLRSEKPDVNEGELSYYEVVLKSGKWFGHRNHLSLRRYSHRPGDEPNRRAIAFALTKQQVEKLFDDLLEIF